jgi:hypothetical protein
VGILTEKHFSGQKIKNRLHRSRIIDIDPQTEIGLTKEMRTVYIMLK